MVVQRDLLTPLHSRSLHTVNPLPYQNVAKVERSVPSGIAGFADRCRKVVWLVAGTGKRRLGCVSVFDGGCGSMGERGERNGGEKETGWVGWGCGRGGGEEEGRAEGRKGS